MTKHVSCDCCGTLYGHHEKAIQTITLSLDEDVSHTRDKEYQITYHVCSDCYAIDGELLEAIEEEVL